MVDAGTAPPPPLRVTRFVRGSLRVEVDGHLGWLVPSGDWGLSNEPAPAQSDEAGFLHCKPATADRVRCVSRFGRYEVTVPAGRFERLVLLSTAQRQPSVLGLTADGSVDLTDLQLTRTRRIARGIVDFSVGVSGLEEEPYVCLVTAARRVLCVGERLPPMLGLEATAAELEGLLLPKELGLRASFVPVAGVRRVVTASTHLCVLLEDGTPSCWGVQSGQLGLGGRPPGSHPQVDDIAVVDHATCLLHDGGVECVGPERPPATLLTEPVEVGADVRVAAVGEGFVCMLRVDGSVRCLGERWRGIEWATGTARPFADERIDALFASTGSRVLCRQTDAVLRCDRLTDRGFTPALAPLRLSRFTRATVSDGSFTGLSERGQVTSLWLDRRPDARRQPGPKVLDLHSNGLLMEGGRVTTSIVVAPGDGRLVHPDLTRVFDTDPRVAMTATGQAFVYGNRCVESRGSGSNELVPLLFGLVFMPFLPFLLPDRCARYEFESVRAPPLDGSIDFARTTGAQCRIDAQGAVRCARGSDSPEFVLLEAEEQDPARSLSSSQHQVCAVKASGRVLCAEWAFPGNLLLSDLRPERVRTIPFTRRRP